MDTEQEKLEPLAAPSNGARFRVIAFAIWLPVCVVQGLVIAWLANEVDVSFNFSPLLFFPLLIGVLLGATTVAMMQLGQLGNRPTILLGLIVATSIAVVGQHYAAYKTYCEQAEQNWQTYQKAKQAFPDMVDGRIPSPPTDFTTYMRQQSSQGRPIFKTYVARGPFAWLSWSLDALLVFASATTLTYLSLRQPYCDHCRSWYHTTRSRRIDINTASKLAAIAQVELPDNFDSARYRILACNGGCAPTGLDLCWEDSQGNSSSLTWLDIERRNQVIEQLDQVPNPTETEDPNN